MKNKIRFCYYEPNYERFYSKALQINPLKKFVFLQRFFLWVAKKFGAEYYADKRLIDYGEITVDTDKLSISQQIYEQIKHLEAKGNRPVWLLIGSKQYRDLINQFGNIADYRLNKTITLEVQNGKFMGLNIVLVPWMDGLIVMEEPTFIKRK